VVEVNGEEVDTALAGVESINADDERGIEASLAALSRRVRSILSNARIRSLRSSFSCLTVSSSERARSVSRRVVVEGTMAGLLVVLPKIASVEPWPDEGIRSGIGGRTVDVEGM